MRDAEIFFTVFFAIIGFIACAVSIGFLIGSIFLWLDGDR